MKVLITGASGLIGSALSSSLESDGHEVIRAVRTDQAGGSTVTWKPNEGWAPEGAFEGLDAVVNLSGASIGGKRWNPSYKKTLTESRLNATGLIAERIAAADNPPRVLINASAIGWYGDRADEVLTEDSSRGSGFLAELVDKWEAATKPATDAGIRVVRIRTGHVISADGGLLGQILLPFKLGLGGPIGSGEQYWSPISITDEVRAIRWCIENEAMRGAVNLAGPDPVPQRQFAKILGGLLRRPAFIPLPALVLRTVFGAQMAQEVLLSGQRVVPTKLLGSGFEFQHPTTEAILSSAVG